MPSQRTPKLTKRPRARQVLAIDADVRGLIGLYLGQFPNYAVAAKNLSVSKDTLAKYVSGNANMALYVFRRMAANLAKRFPEPELTELLGGTTPHNIATRARRSNLRQTDHVVYEMNDAIRELLRLHCENFSSRNRAAQSLDVNPRTFKAYVNGQIHSFPRVNFWRLVHCLTENNATESWLLDHLGLAEWDDILTIRQRAPTIDLTSDELVERLIPAFEAGSMKALHLDPSLLNLSKRIHGSLGQSFRLVIQELAARQQRAVAIMMRDSNIDGARAEIIRWEHYISTYATKVKSIYRALPRDRKWDWRAEVVQLVQAKEESKNRVRQLETGLLPVWIDPESQRYCVNSHARAYDPGVAYQTGDRIIHPVFGSGKVTSLDRRDRMTVVFNQEFGSVTLAFNGIAHQPELR